MAATIAIARGIDPKRTKEIHRLGHESAVAEANTWRTFTRAEVHADGSGSVCVTRDGQVLHEYHFDAEAR